MNLYKKQGKATLPLFTPDIRMNRPEYYWPSDGLVDAVNVALALGQPLLLTGEPGTGKTQLAFHVAHFFGLDHPLIHNVQTSSVASELFYKYDALGHFQYNQNHAELLAPEALEDRFIHYNALGEAIRQQKRRVVLIDEIDKAPRDLPNDILYAIENLSFRVPEIGRAYQSSPEYRPIILMTSNSEKNLPDAFMRRVVYYHIPFPDPADLLRILHLKTEQLPAAHLERAVEHFTKIRSLKLKKLPSTAEMIYWVLLLAKMEFPIQQLNGALNAQERQQLHMSYSVLAKNKEDLDLLKGI